MRTKQKTKKSRRTRVFFICIINTMDGDPVQFQKKIEWPGRRYGEYPPQEIIYITKSSKMPTDMQNMINQVQMEMMDEINTRNSIRAFLIRLKSEDTDRYLRACGEELVRRMSAEASNKSLEMITKFWDERAHAVPGTSDGEVEWLCSPVARRIIYPDETATLKNANAM